MRAFLRSSALLLAVFATIAVSLAADKIDATALAKSAQDYVAKYATTLNAVAADEEFTQYETSSGRMGAPRRLNSAIVLLGQNDGSILSFRDVVAVDNTPVRQKDDRLAALFKNVTEASIASAQEMTEDAVRSYYSANLHVLDRPMLALDLLRPEKQGDYTFKVEGSKTINGVQTGVLKFNEKGTGHLMPNAAAVGRFWVELVSGAIQQTELGFVAKGANVHATVKFTKDPQLGILLPSELFEQIEASSAGTGMNNMGAGIGAATGSREAMEGRAIYSKYRPVR